MGNNIRPFSPIYDKVMPFHDGICWVRLHNWGAIDRYGHTVIPFIYQSFFRIAPNVYRVLSTNGKYGLVDNEGKVIVDPEYDCIVLECSNIIRLTLNQAIRYINLRGEILFKDIDIDSPIVEINSCFYISSDTCNYLYFNENEHICVPNDLILEGADQSHAAFILIDDNARSLYVYNTKGEIVLKYEDVEPYNFANDPLCNDTVIIKRKHGLVLHNLSDHTEIILEHVDDYVKSDDGHIVVITEDKKWGLIDRLGQTIIPCTYDGLGNSFGNSAISGFYHNDKYIAASRDGKSCGIIGMNEETVVPFEYTSLKQASKDDPDLLIARKDGKYGVISLDNEVVIGFEYSSLSEFYNGVAIARKDGNAGAIDINGNIIIPFKYDSIAPFCYLGRETEYTIAVKDRKYTVFDIFGNVTIEENRYTEIQDTGFGLFKVLKSGGFDWFLYKDRVLEGYCDMFGRETIPWDLHYSAVPINVSIYGATADIEKITTSPEYNYYADLIEVNGYYIYNDNINPKSGRTTTCIINPDKHIIFNSNDFGSISFIREDDDYIYLEHKFMDRDTRCDSKSTIVIDKATRDIQVTKHISDDGDLYIIERNGKFGVAHKEFGQITAIEYDRVEISGEIIHVQKDGVTEILQYR